MLWCASAGLSVDTISEYETQGGITGNLRRVLWVLFEVNELVPFTNVERIELVAEEWVEGNGGRLAGIKFLVEGVFALQVVMCVLELYLYIYREREREREREEPGIVSATRCG